MNKPVISNLFIHEDEVKSLFSILGNKENDMSYALGYVLSKSSKLLREFIKKLHNNIIFTNAVIKLQESGEDAGYTDFEITLDNEYFFVIEAKKGWKLPSTNQLKRYLKRFRHFKGKKRAFVLISDCEKDYVCHSFPNRLYGIPIMSFSWSNIITLIDEVRSSVPNKQKLLLHELKDYLKEVVIMENQESNRVFVVSLAKRAGRGIALSPKEIVYDRKYYFYPQGKNWPKIPPNYISFRFDGKLQSIHHVEKYEVVEDVHEYIPEIRKGKIKNYFLLWLGPRFEPRKELPNGNIWSNGRRWCMLDTLFTSKTIKEASEITKKRE